MSFLELKNCRSSFFVFSNSIFGQALVRALGFGGAAAALAKLAPSNDAVLNATKADGDAAFATVDRLGSGGRLSGSAMYGRAAPSPAWALRLSQSNEHTTMTRPSSIHCTDWTLTSVRPRADSSPAHARSLREYMTWATNPHTTI